MFYEVDEKVIHTTFGKGVVFLGGYNPTITFEKAMQTDGDSEPTNTRIVSGDFAGLSKVGDDATDDYQEERDLYAKEQSIRSAIGSAASNAEDFGATPKQIGFLTNLLAKRDDAECLLMNWGLTLANSNARLTKKDASGYIDCLLG